MKASLISSIFLLGSTAAAFPGGKKRYCSQAEIALATGIHLNINGQYGEYNGTLKVQQIEQSSPTAPTTDFYIAKGMLEADVQAGMNIRLFNQQIAPPNSPALPGLQQYAQAQETEAAQAKSLTGIYATDEPVFEKLKVEIMQGIQLNEKNLQAAVSECDFYLEFPPENEMGS